MVQYKPSRRHYRIEYDHRYMDSSIDFIELKIRGIAIYIIYPRIPPGTHPEFFTSAAPPCM